MEMLKLYYVIYTPCLLTHPLLACLIVDRVGEDEESGGDEDERILEGAGVDERGIDEDLWIDP